MAPPPEVNRVVALARLRTTCLGLSWARP